MTALALAGSCHYTILLYFSFSDLCVLLDVAFLCGQGCGPVLLLNLGADSPVTTVWRSLN